MARLDQWNIGQIFLCLSPEIDCCISSCPPAQPMHSTRQGCLGTADLIGLTLGSMME